MVFSTSLRTRGYLSLAGGFLLHFVYGTLYLYGSMNTYIASYMQNSGQNLTNSDTNLVLPFMVLAISIGNPFGITLAKKFGFKTISLVCSIVLSFSVYFSSYAISNFPLFLSLFGIAFGLSSGIGYMIPFNLAYSYFPSKRGLVSGIISAGYGFGSTVYIWVVYALVNPNDLEAVNVIAGEKYYTSEVTDNLPLTIRVLGASYAVILLIGTLMLQQPTEAEIKQIEEEVNNSQESSVEVTLIQPAECPSLKDGLKQKVIYVYMVLVFLVASFGAMTVANYRTYGQSMGYSTKYLSALGTAGSVMNGLSRLFWGWALQRYSISQILQGNLVIQIVTSFTFRWASDSSIAYFGYVTAAYFAYGGWFALMPPTITKIFGKKFGTTIYFVPYAGFTIAYWFSFFAVKNLRIEIGWGNLFWVFSGLQIAASVIGYFTKFKIDWSKYQRLTESSSTDKT